MASGPQSNMDFTKFFAEMKLPMLPDAEAFLTANRRISRPCRRPIASLWKARRRSRGGTWRLCRAT